MLPLVGRTEDLTQRAFKVGELSAIELTTAQQRTLRARREYLESLVRYRTALIDLESATGAPLSQAVDAQPQKMEPAPAPAPG